MTKLLLQELLMIFKTGFFPLSAEMINFSLILFLLVENKR